MTGHGRHTKAGVSAESQTDAQPRGTAHALSASKGWSVIVKKTTTGARIVFNRYSSLNEATAVAARLRALPGASMIEVEPSLATDIAGRERRGPA